MLEIKAAMHASDAPPRRLKRLEPAVGTAVDACTAFLDKFEPEGKPPAKVEVDQERAYLQCRFHRARAHGKLETAGGLGASLREYEALAGYLERNAVEGMDEERKVAREMVELLPHKIRNVQRAAAQGA